MGRRWSSDPDEEGPIAVRLTILGSGSTGNAAHVAYGDVHVLIDAGLSRRELSRRLEAVHVEPDSIRAIFVTHAHVDHVRSVASFSRRHGVPVYATGSTRGARGGRLCDVAAWKALSPGQPVEVSALRFLPFVVPHDAIETLAFRIDTPDGSIGFATDVGSVTAELAARFRPCRLLVVESNHAVELLRVSPYAPSVRERIAGDQGHLSNEALGTFVVEHLGDAVRCLVLAHLSQVNNVPALAELTCREALARRGRAEVRVVVAGPDRPTDTLDLARLGAAIETTAPGRSMLAQPGLPFA